MTTLLEKLERQLTTRNRPREQWEDDEPIHIEHQREKIDGFSATPHQIQVEERVVISIRYWADDRFKLPDEALEQRSRQAKMMLANFLYSDVLTKLLEIESHIHNRSAREAIRACAQLRKTIRDVGEDDG